MSGNIVLEYLDCSNNQLARLDVSKNPKLITLHYNGNPLTNMSSGSGGLTTASSAIERTFEFINGRTFEGTYNLEQVGFSILKNMIRLTFLPSSISKGSVNVEIIGKVSSMIQGQNRNTRDNEIQSYYITDDGEIVIKGRIYKANYRDRDLTSDIRDNHGSIVKFQRLGRMSFLGVQID
jgi:hypothetical protein